MKISPVTAWRNLWFGVFWDFDNRILYVFPVPCLGFTVEFGRS